MTSPRALAVGGASSVALPSRVLHVPAQRRESAAVRGRAFVADTLWLLALVAGLPFCIIAVAAPVVLALRLLLWLTKLL